MFCKYCGTKIEGNIKECPKCGRSVAYEGGIGFWDMADISRDSTDVQKKTIIADEEASAKNNMKRAENSLNSIVSIAVSLLCIAMTVFTFIKSDKEIKQLSQKYEQAILSINSSADEIINTLRSQINISEEKIHSLEGRVSALEKPHSNIEVLDLPQDVSWALDYSFQEGDEMPLALRIKGKAIYFEWAKQAEDGSWEPIIFEDYYGRMRDSKNGLLLIEERDKGTSAIVPYGLTEEGEGLYQCTAVTIHGQIAVDARITISDKQENNSEEEHDEFTYGNTSLAEVVHPKYPADTPDPYSLPDNGDY